MYSGKDRTYYVCTETLQEATEWVEALRKNVAALPGGEDGGSSEMSEPNKRDSVGESEAGLFSGSGGCFSDSGGSCDVRSIDSINSSGGWSEGMSPRLRPSGSSSSLTLTNEAGVLQDEIDVIKREHPFIDNDILAWRLLRNISYSVFPFKQSSQQRESVLRATSFWMMDTYNETEPTETPSETTETNEATTSTETTTTTTNPINPINPTNPTDSTDSPATSPSTNAIPTASPIMSPPISPLSVSFTAVPDVDGNNNNNSKHSIDEVELCVMGQAADLVQGINELFKKEGIPSMDIDRFAHAYDLLVPRSLCIWARLGRSGGGGGGSGGERGGCGCGSECGWRISNTVSGGFTGAVACLADPSSVTTEPILRWFEGHRMEDVTFAGRSTREAPRRTEICVTLPGATLDERIAVAIDGVTRFAPKKRKVNGNGNNASEKEIKREESKKENWKKNNVWEEIKSAGSLDGPVYFIVEFSCIKVVRVSVAMENRMNKNEYVMYRWCECCYDVEKEEGENEDDDEDKDNGGCVKPIKIRCKKLSMKK